jgi:crotonobetainyl-CoA:carnitine CoA-transferase CaiB-like acyl-CoA transferase
MEVSRPDPLLGQHNDGVLSELLGYSGEKIDDLRAGKVIT